MQGKGATVVVVLAGASVVVTTALHTPGWVVVVAGAGVVVGELAWQLLLVMVHWPAPALQVQRQVPVQGAGWLPGAGVVVVVVPPQQRCSVAHTGAPQVSRAKSRHW